MGSATGISFANAAGTSVSGSSGLLTSYNLGTGSFAALGNCSSGTTGCGTIKNISSFTSAAPISQFLTFSTTNGATVSFDLTSIGAVNHNMDPTGGSIAFTASGLINFTGYESTAGVFSLVSVGNQITSFSATTLASNTPIPEPMSLALLGGGLAAIGLIRGKRQSN